MCLSRLFYIHPCSVTFLMVMYRVNHSCLEVAMCLSRLFYIHPCLSLLCATRGIKMISVCH